MTDARIPIGITAWQTERWSAEALSTQGRLAEELGFHSYWLPENHFGDERSVPSPLTLLAAVAATTHRLKLATTSYLLPIRHPLQAAEEVAVLDQLCEGRLILGLGRGVQGDLFNAFDIDPKAKRGLFASKLDVMRSAWAGEALTDTKGDKATRLAPLPVQQPSPPLWVAAFGPLALKQAGSLGLPYLASPLEPLAKLVENYQLHAEAAVEAGMPVPTERPVMRTVFINEDARLCQRVAEALERRLPPQFRQDGVEIGDWAIIGSANEAHDRLMNYRDDLGINLLIAGGRLPALEETALRANLEACAALSLPVD